MEASTQESLSRHPGRGFEPPLPPVQEQNGLAANNNVRDIRLQAVQNIRYSRVLKPTLKHLTSPDAQLIHQNVDAISKGFRLEVHPLNLIRLADELTHVDGWTDITI